MNYKTYLIVSLYSLAPIGCEGDFSSNIQEDARNIEAPTENGSETDPENNSKSAKLLSAECIDPELSKVLSSESLMLCDGTVVSGTLDLPDLTNLAPEAIKAGTTIAGITGTYTPPTPDYPEAGNVLNVDSVNNIPGSIEDHGNWNMELVFPGAGMYAVPTNIPASSEVCSSTVFNGVSGSADCGAFQGNMTSFAFHDQGSAQLNLTEEHATPIGSVPIGQREIPNVASDDFGHADYATVGIVTRSNAEWNAGSNRVVCGKLGTTVEAKILDCDTRHSVDIRPDFDASADDGKISWDGRVQGNASEGSWTLITVYSPSLAEAAICDASCSEVWRDDRTGLVWSDKIGGTSVADHAGEFTWCEATGNTENAGSIDCTPGAEAGFNEWTDGSTYEGISLCAETSAALNSMTYPPLTPDGTGATTDTGGLDAWDDTGTAVLDAKGGMKLSSSPAVRWRLPTIHDQAQSIIVNGGQYVLPNFRQNSPKYWSATINAFMANYAFTITGELGITDLFINQLRSQTFQVRCVGRL